MECRCVRDRLDMLRGAEVGIRSGNGPKLKAVKAGKNCGTLEPIQEFRYDTTQTPPRLDTSGCKRCLSRRVSRAPARGKARKRSRQTGSPPSPSGKVRRKDGRLTPIERVLGEELIIVAIELLEGNLVRTLDAELV